MWRKAACHFVDRGQCRRFVYNFWIHKGINTSLLSDVDLTFFMSIFCAMNPFSQDVGVVWSSGGGLDDTAP